MRRAEVGDLVLSTDDAWIVRAPQRCPNGHTLAAGQVLVGHAACTGHGGGHTSWTCRTCEATVYGPALSTHCSVIDGPAAVRISNKA